MPNSQKNNDMERRCEYHFNITNKYFENERPYDESKSVVDGPLSKKKTETTENVIDKETYKDLGKNTKKKKIKRICATLNEFSWKSIFYLGCNFYYIFYNMSRDSTVSDIFGHH